MDPAITFGEWVEYAASRWRFVLAALTCAVLITFVISELLPKRYTATATLIIDPPPGSDPRAGVAVNPTYLESLRTFEHFFTSDTLFLRACEHFHLGRPGDSVAGLKKRILKVSKLRDTRILEVSATLADPVTAHELVHFIADQSVAATREEASATDRQFQEQTSAAADVARRNLEQARAEWDALSRAGGPEPIQSELDSDIGSLAEMQRKAAEAAAESAEWTVRAHDGDADNRHSAELQARAAAARATEYQKVAAKTDSMIAEKRRQLGAVSGRRDVAQASLESAQNAYDAALAKMRDLTTQLGTRGEALRMIDPGVVPTRPSFPNVLLNIAAAVLLALCFASLWITMSLGRVKRRRAPAAITGRAA